MVQAPGVLTRAGQDVRKLKSRSVAVIRRLLPLASNRKLERIGIVFLRSTTPCAAASSFRRPDLSRLISIFDGFASMVLGDDILPRPRSIFGFRYARRLQAGLGHCGDSALFS